MKDHIKFYNGQKFPIVGLGTWQASNPAEFEEAIEAALTVGYRHFDTAYMYQNEEVLGNVLKRWLDAGKVKREELFIVTKLPMIGMRPQHVSHFLNLSLKKLQLDYVDLYLVHCTIGFTYVNDNDIVPMKDGKILLDVNTSLEAVWKSMENQVDKGLARSIGISNFAIPQIQRLLKISRIQPANIQVELNASFQQRELQEFCKKNNITICAYGPIGSPGRKQLYESRGQKFEVPSLLEDPTVVEIAKKYNKTAAQILLHFLALKDIVVIPKSTSPDRLKKNFEIFDFTLRREDVESLENLDKKEAGRTFLFDFFPGCKDHPEFPKF